MYRDPICTNCAKDVGFFRHNLDHKIYCEKCFWQTIPEKTYNVSIITGTLDSTKNWGLPRFDETLREQIFVPVTNWHKKEGRNAQHYFTSIDDAVAFADKLDAALCYGASPKFAPGVTVSEPDSENLITVVVVTEFARKSKGGWKKTFHAVHTTHYCEQSYEATDVRLARYSGGCHDRRVKEGRFGEEVAQESNRLKFSGKNFLEIVYNPATDNVWCVLVDHNTNLNPPLGQFKIGSVQAPITAQEVSEKVDAFLSVMRKSRNPRAAVEAAYQVVNSLAAPPVPNRT